MAVPLAVKDLRPLEAPSASLAASLRHRIGRWRGRQEPASADAAQPGKVRRQLGYADAYTLAMTGKRDSLWWFTACWAVLSAACCLYRFFWSTFPVTGVDEPPGPGSVILVGEISIVISALLALGSIPLFTIGFLDLRHAWRNAVAWAAAGAANVALQISYGLGFGVHWVSPIYSGPAVVDWVYLPESAGLLLTGSVMAWMWAGSGRWSSERAGG
jgi:hypothetical protein